MLKNKIEKLINCILGAPILFFRLYFKGDRERERQRQREKEREREREREREIGEIERERDSGRKIVYSHNFYCLFILKQNKHFLVGKR